jgi:hypothetical protein
MNLLKRWRRWTMPLGAWLGLAGAGPAFATALGIAGNAFTLDGQPTFLLGVSYYGALGAPEEFLRRDLADFRAHGFNWLRVWATWSAFGQDVSAVDAEGRPREPYLRRLVWLVAECERRGLVVDVTLHREAGEAGRPRLATLVAHQRAVETLLRALAAHRNWYLDLANERNIRDARYVSGEELRELRTAVKRLDPRLLVTASHAGGDLTRADVHRYVTEIQLDFLAPHRPREPGSAAQTEAHTRALLGWLAELGRPVPVLYQEPFRRGYGDWQPTAADFWADLTAAQRGGAAGWCFHNGATRGVASGEPRRSFDLSRRRLFDQWDAEERRFLTRLATQDGATEVDPGPAPWPRAEPAAVGLKAGELQAFGDWIGGNGCVVRAGYLVHAWGDPTRRADVASAVKPVFSLFLFKALEAGRIPSLDEAVVRWEPRLGELNPTLGHKDRRITWQHLGNQTSGYGVAEPPGTAFCYNDWQMALFADLLFQRVYGVPWPEVDARVLGPELADPLGCEDHPTLLAFGAADRPGRLAISPRDFARFGLLFLQQGRWAGRPLLRADLARLAVHSPLPASLPRAGFTAAAMLPGQRTLGSPKVPDNQCDHDGSYSWLWWVNGANSAGQRHWPEAPADTFAALGHGGRHGVVVMPELRLIASWNNGRPDTVELQNEAFRRLRQTVSPIP